MMDDIVFISKAFLCYLSEDESDVFSRNPGIQYEMVWYVNPQYNFEL